MGLLGFLVISCLANHYVNARRTLGPRCGSHAELRVDALMDPDTDKVGMLQLRSEVEDNRNREFAKQFHQQYKIGDNCFLADRIQQKWSTFYVVGRHLRGCDLPGKGITKALTEFAQTFQ